MIFNKIFLVLTGSLVLIASSPVFAKQGTESGGGGDATELRINEIRSDFLIWLNNGGAKSLVLPDEVSYHEYESIMTNILQPQKVILALIEKDDENNEELQVKVNGIPKTCRGFMSQIDSKPHIICNISRFKNSSESEQYKLIHHEYAGLVNIENNDGAASDYSISLQITDYLKEQKILKLAVKKNNFKKKSYKSLTKDCARRVEEVSKNYASIQQRISSGDISPAAGRFLISGEKDTAEMVALSCAGIKLISMEKSFLGHLGMINQEKADQIAESTREEALDYFNSLIEASLH